jgi:hypothetical protein
MSDSLFARAQLAIEESRTLQQRSVSLRNQHDLQREELRRAVFECAMYRSEMKARSDDQS